MTNHPRWITFSLEIQKENWQDFFSRIGEPFLAYLKSIYALETYYVELGDSGLFVSVRLNSFAGINLITELKSFILENPPASTEVKVASLKVKEYHFHNYDFIDQSLDFYFSEAVSDLIIHALAADGFGESDLMFFSLHLHFGWIKMRSMVTLEPMSSIIMKGYSWFLPRADGRSVLQKLEEAYQANEVPIQALYDSMMSTDPLVLSCLPTWTKTWLQSCSDILYRNISHYFNNEHLNDMTYYIIPNLINKQLGISQERALLQMYSINRAILSGAKRKA